MIVMLAQHCSARQHRWTSPLFSPHDDGRLALLVKLHTPVNTVSEIKKTNFRSLDLQRIVGTKWELRQLPAMSVYSSSPPSQNLSALLTVLLVLSVCVSPAIHVPDFLPSCHFLDKQSQQTLAVLGQCWSIRLSLSIHNSNFVKAARYRSLIIDDTAIHST